MSLPKVAVVTVSDGVTAGTRSDDSGDAAEAMLHAAGFDVDARRVVPDERAEIEAVLRALAADHALVVTTGGTGFGPRDVTPEATRAVIDREAPGLPEMMRSAGLVQTPLAALSRSVAGSVGATLIVNLPGSPRGVRESLESVLTILPHAVELLSGSTGPHPTGHGAAEAGDLARLRKRDGAREASLPAPPEPGTVVITAVKRIGNPPCPVGAKIAIGSDGPIEGTLGCAEFDSAAVGAAREALASGEPGTRTFSHELGDIEVFVEPLPAPPRLVVFSATPVALELLRLGRGLAYETTLVETRTERVTPAYRAAADQVAASLEGVPLDDRTDAVHTDHDAPGVTDSIATLLSSPARFVGVMGSRRHVSPHVEALKEMGFTEDKLARVRSPVGVDLGAKTPQEIALSIAAGLVAARTGRDGGWLDR